MAIKNNYELQDASKEFEELQQELRETLELIKILRKYVSVENKKGLNLFDRSMNKIVERVNEYFNIITNNSSRLENRKEACSSLLSMLANDKYNDYIKSTIKSTDGLGQEATKLKSKLENLYRDNRKLTILNNQDKLIEISSDPKKTFKTQIAKIGDIFKRMIEIEKEINEYYAAYNERMAKRNIADKEEKNEEQTQIIEKTKEEPKSTKINKEKENNESTEEKPIFTSQEIDEEERKNYEKYKEIRAELDELFEKKNSFKDEESFEQEVVSKLQKYNLGKNYEEIINNVIEMRKSLTVTKDIEKIIAWVENDYYDNPEEMYEVEKNKFTKLENQIIGRLLVVGVHGKVSPELLEEIQYYSKRKLTAEDKIKGLRFENHTSEEYPKLVEDIKERYLVNTLLIDENNFIKSNSKTK